MNNNLCLDINNVVKTTQPMLVVILYMSTRRHVHITYVNINNIIVVYCTNQIAIDKAI